MANIKIYLADEHELFREAVNSRLTSIDPGIEISGMTDSLQQPVGKVQELLSEFEVIQPEVLVVGTNRLSEQVLALIARIRRAYPLMGTVLISGQHGIQECLLLRRYLRDIRKAAAYLLRSSIESMEGLSRVIRSVNDGRLIVEPDLYSATLEECGPTSVILKSLDSAELTVLNWVSKGYTDPAISQILSADETTVQKRFDSILRKLKPFIPPSRVPKTAAILAYLRATGSLLDESAPWWPEVDAEPTPPSEERDPSIAMD
jgi:DNA-binding NarL/FixJ family response regulator